ncbi:MAG: cysteine hydrolase [Lachnospiraceae bacterium]|jgi:nicotinamidase-related amidase|nr:cysteine hydrolase [Lachnospiraceae bacterium]
MKQLLVIVDMQNDFIEGTLGTKEAQRIVDNVAAKIAVFQGDAIYATLDTHHDDYLNTTEGRYLPVKHCIRGSNGWMLHEKVKNALTTPSSQTIFIEKPTFGSIELATQIAEKYRGEELEIELAGLCTDICIVTNALLLKTMLPDATIIVDSSSCAGVTPASHEAALTTMKMCQIKVV